MRKLVTILFISAFIGVKAGEVDKATLKKGDIIGTVIDASSGVHVEYATIALYDNNNKLTNGGISDSEGFFRLKNTPIGTYKVSITFMGYTTKDIPNIKILEDTKEIDLGKIKLSPNVKELDGVDVVADQASVQYKIDKKVVNVSQQLTAKSGTAVDILENVPSVKVDIEGNVTLRGSGSFTVLIDGRPTALEPSDALSQIPSGAIENIEIITNPSAKYEPDGTSGIINIVTKKNKLNGFSGIVNANVGNHNRYGSDFTLDLRQEKYHVYMGAEYNNRDMIGDLIMNKWTLIGTDTLFSNSLGTFSRGRQSTSINGGIDWDFTKSDVIGLNLRLGTRDSKGGQNRTYTDRYSTGTESTYSTEEESKRGGGFYSATLDYKHTFNEKKEHYLQFQVNSSYRDGNDNSENYTRANDLTILNGKKTTEDGPSSEYRIKLDYAQPLSWGGKFEAGMQAQIQDSKDNTELYEYNIISNQFEIDSAFSKTTEYTRNTYATYGILGGEWGDFGYQAGLRMEYTYRLLELKSTGESYKIDRPDFFPTLHFSYNLPADQQTMISYTRRIERPRGWFLEPFLTYMDANNVRRGNPELLPEYVNSMDLGYQKKFKQNFVSLEAYYRVTQNKIERVIEKFNDEGVRLQTFKNIGTDYAFGAEFMTNYSPAKWFTTNLMMDLYDYRLKGHLNDTTSVDQHDFSWNARWNNTFKVGPNTRFQVDLNYRSASVNAQGTTSEFYTISAALKQDFFKRKLSATFQVRDIFGTMKHDHTYYGPDTYDYSKFAPDTPIFTLSLSYKLNNFKVKRGEQNGNNGGEMDEGGDF